MLDRARSRSSGSETETDVRSTRDTRTAPVARTQTMTDARRQTAFPGLDPPKAWPPTPRALRPDRLELALASLPGVAATTQRKLEKLGLSTVRDVLEHRPRRYETAADEVSIAALREGEEVVVTGQVLNVEKRPMRGRRRTRIVARVDDGTAAVSVTWFNQPWLPGPPHPRPGGGGRGD